MKTLRDRGWMEVSWGWYRYVRWIWPVLIVLTVSLSVASSAGTWGSGWAFKKSVREGQVIETVVFKTYAMVMVWRLGPQEEDANGSAFLERDLGRLWRSSSKPPLKRRNWRLNPVRRRWRRWKNAWAKVGYISGSTAK